MRSRKEAEVRWLRQNQRRAAGLLHLLRRGWDYQVRALAACEISASCVRVIPRFAGRAEICLLVLNPYPRVQITPFHFRLDDSDALVYSFDSVARIDDNRLLELGDMISLQNFGLVVVVGVVQVFHTLAERFFGSVPIQEAEFVEYQKTLTQITNLSEKIRSTFAQRDPVRSRIIEAIHDPTNRLFLWDISRALSRAK